MRTRDYGLLTNGVLFLVYFILLIVGPAVVALTCWKAYRLFLTSLPPAGSLGATILFVLPLSAWLIVLIYGSFLGYLYPWGPSYESQWASAFSLRASFRTTQLSLQMIHEAFFHAKTLAGGFLFAVLVAYIVTARRNTSMRVVLELSIFCGLCSLSLTLFGYAQSVFPNLPYNLGGGQPRLVQLHVREADSSVLSATGLAMEIRQGQPVVSVPLALWHQDTSFLYVTPASTQDSSAARLTAITAGAVEVVTYLGGYVKVTAGGRIQDAHVVIRSER